MRKNLAIGFLSLTLLIPAVSNAARNYGDNRIGEFFGEVYLGIKYGEITIADGIPENGSDIRNFGVVFGKGVNEVLSVEFDYTSTVSKDDNYFGSDFSATADTIALFLVAKTPGTVYAKGKLGYSRVRQQFGDSSATLDPDLAEGQNIYGVAYGVGAGVELGKAGAIEFEYTVFPTRDDITVNTGTLFGQQSLDLEMDFISLTYVLSFK